MEQAPLTQPTTNRPTVKKKPWQRKDLARFLSHIPQLSGARNLMQNLDTVTQQVSLHVLTHCPEYVEEVGEAGLDACARDNRLTLLRTAQLLSGPQPRPQEALLWWWEASVGGYLVHRARAALEANLQGMYQSLDSHLHDAEVKPMVDLVSNMYQEALGLQLKVHSAVQLQTENLALQGPKWQAVFAPTAADDDTQNNTLDWFAEQGSASSASDAASLRQAQDSALRQAQDSAGLATDTGEASLPVSTQYIQSLPQAVQQALQDVMQVKTQKILWTFIEANLQHGDEEAAWHKAQPLIERSLRSQSSAVLLSEWRGLLAHLPQWMTPAASAYWTDTLLRGLEVIAQVSLGRVLQAENKRLGGDIAAYLMQQRVVRKYSPKDANSAALDAAAEQKCKRDLSLLFEAMGQILTQDPPSLAALNLSRYLVQNIAPFVDYPGRVWRIVWLKLQEGLWANLNPQAQNQLLLWVAQLQDLCDELNTTRPLGEAVFHQAAPVFGDPNIAEQDWRNLLGGLLSAALTSEQAPYPSHLLTQRLLLASPVFRHLDANQWQSIHTSLTDSFAELLPAALIERLQQAQASISHSLLRLSMCDSLAGGELRLRFYLALPDLPYLAHSWHIHLWGKHAAPQGGNLLLNPQDRLLGELNHWALPDMQALQASFEIYASVTDSKQFLALPRSGAEHGNTAKPDRSSETGQVSLADEYALNLRCLALYGQTSQLQAVLYNNWLFLESVAKPHALMSDWFDALPSSHVLADTAAVARQHLPKFAVARRLLNPQQDLAAELFPTLQVNPCIDLGFVLQQIGVSYTGLLPQLDLARWYHDNVAVFISLRTRQRNAKLWSPLVQNLSKGWSQPEQKLLLEAVKNLARPLASKQKMPRLSVRHFDLQGALWQQVFHAAAPSPALTALQQVLPSCSTSISAAVYQGLEGFCQAWLAHGDIEAAWQRLQQYWQTQLTNQSTATLYQDWQAALPILAQHLSPVQEAYWLHTLQKGLNLLAQTGLGLRLQQQADDIAKRVAQRLASAQQGFNDYGLADPIMATAKCRRDQALLLQAVGEILSQQPPSLAALNVGRYIIQNIAPFVSYNSGVWQLIWLAWQDASANLLDATEKQAMRQWREQLSSLSLHLTSIYALDLFAPSNPAQTPDNEMRLDTIGGLLCAAATPDSAPIPGNLLLQRLVLSSPLFAQHTAASWQPVQAELAQELVALDPSELHSSLLQRYNQIVDLLFKLPRLQEWQNFSGDEIEALLLSAAPEAELTWHLSQYASQHISPSAVLVQQSNGWSGIPSPSAGRSQPAQQQLAQQYQVIRQFDYSQPLSNGKWYQRNQPDSLPTAAVPVLQTLLCQLSLYQQLNPSVSAQTLRFLISQTWQTLQDLQLGLQKGSLLNFAQLWQQQQAGQPQVAQLAILLTQHLPAVTAGHKLLNLNFDKHLAKVTAVARCAADARYVLQQMGANLCGEPQASPLDCWYAQHVGRFLKPTTRQSEVQFFNKLPKVWTDVFDAEEQAAIAPLLAALQKGLSFEPPPTQVEWTVSR